MEKYSLKTNCGETIKTIEGETMDEAIEIFSQIKALPIDSLLEVFTVVVAD